MKIISEKRALARLSEIKEELRVTVAPFEANAKSCLTCETPGSCCLDAHFVNVRISRLEAVAFRKRIESLEEEQRVDVLGRIDAAIEEHGLAADRDVFEQKFACPLFEKGTGCLVHEHGKPAACIVHACYERKDDLPPSGLQFEADLKVDKLNTRTYGAPQPWLPIPLAIKRAG